MSLPLSNVFLTNNSSHGGASDVQTRCEGQIHISTLSETAKFSFAISLLTHRGQGFKMPLVGLISDSDSQH